MLKNLMPQIADTYGMFYMRLVRKGVRKVYEPGSTFTIGKAVHLREGKDVTIMQAATVLRRRSARRRSCRSRAFRHAC